MGRFAPKIHVLNANEYEEKIITIIPKKEIGRKFAVYSYRYLFRNDDYCLNPVDPDEIDLHKKKPPNTKILLPPPPTI